MLRFRPYPGLTLFCTVMFAVLCGLGIWQLERLQWKLALIAAVNGHAAAAPAGLDAILKMPADEAQYRRVALAGRFDHAREAYVFTTDTAGEPVYHVITPFTLDDGRSFLVDRGMVPAQKLTPGTRAAGNVAGPVRLIGVWRIPDAPGFFTPAPDPVHRVWYARDVAAIARADHLRLAAPVIVEADATPNAGGWPLGGQTVVAFRNEHLSYAVTWFGLAAAVFGVWLAYHISKARLSWK